MGITLKVWATPELTDLVSAKKATLKTEKYMNAVRPLLDPVTIAMISTVDSDDDNDSYSDSDDESDGRLLKYAPEGTRFFQLRAKVKAFGMHVLNSKGEIILVHVNPHDILFFKIMDSPAEFKALDIEDDVYAAFKSHNDEMRAYRQKYLEDGHFRHNYKTAGGRTGNAKSYVLLKVYVPGDVEQRKATVPVAGSAAGAA